MKIRLTPFCSLWLLFVFAAGSLSLSAALPDRSGVLKRRKNFEISKFISPLYRQYVDDLTQLQPQFIAAQKFADAKRLQEEIQRNIGYVQQLGKGYQFIFAAPSPLPREGHLLRAARNHKIKLSVGNILKQYLAQQNKEQTFYLKGREFPKANAVQEEIKQATIELSRLRGIDSAIGNAVPQNNAPARNWVSLLSLKPVTIKADFKQQYYADSAKHTAKSNRLLKKFPAIKSAVDKLQHWIFMHPTQSTGSASSTYVFDKPITEFSASVRVLMKKGDAIFIIFNDGELVERVPLKGDAPKDIQINLDSCKKLRLEIRKGSRFGDTWALWINPKVR